MRRSAPRPVAAALAQVTREAEPPALLARVQACWGEVVGAAIAAEAEPVGERAGVLTVRCRSAVWAQEIQLLGEDLLGRLNGALSGGRSTPLSELRVRTSSRPS